MSFCAIMVGDPIEGFQLVGPFKQEHYAVDWASEWLADQEWWVLPLNHTEGFENGRIDQTDN